VESVSAIPASVGKQNRKIFVSLIEKNFGGALLKNDEKIFLFCSPSGGEPPGGIAALRAAISRCFLGNEFQLFPTNTTITNINKVLKFKNIAKKGKVKY
jgi:hypothetical protein